MPNYRKFWVSICIMVCAGASELAMACDLGGSIGSAIVGRFTQFAGDDIRIGMRLGLVFPVVLIIMLILMSRISSKSKLDTEE